MPPSSGLPGFSPIALGLWRAGSVQLPQARLVELIAASLDAGINTFDLADIYGDYAGEAAFGAALSAAKVPRDAVRLITKCAVRSVTSARPANRVKHYDNSGDHLRDSVDASLKTLATDCIDLFLVHRPDFLLDADELAAALQDVVRAGKVRRVGVSNFSPSQQRLLASRLHDLPGGLAANQVELSVLRREPFTDGTLDLCQEQRCVPMAWSPLGGGELFSGTGEAVLRVRTALVEVGEAIGATGLDQVALAWLMRHPSGIVPVLGSTDPARVQSAARAASLRLDRQQWYQIWQAATGVAIP